MRIRTGAYIDVPSGEAFQDLRARTRSLSGLLNDLGKYAEKRLTVAVPFISPPVLHDWLHLWTNDNPELRVRMIHRQVPNSATEATKLAVVIRKWSTTGRVEFLTFPDRDPTSFHLRKGPTFHSKLIDIDSSHLIVMSANLNEHSRSQNAEVGYVFGPREAQDVRRFLRALEKAASPDPLSL